MKRTNIELDEKLLDAIKKETGLKTSKDVVNFSLEAVWRLSKQKRILKLYGLAKGKENYWDLVAWRKGRFL